MSNLEDEWFLDNGKWFKVVKEYNEERTDWEYVVYANMGVMNAKITASKITATENTKNYEHCLNNAKELVK